ncbi:MAG: class A beta-lactamase-related serine hydrolase [Gemmatimonadota bacterium]|nr:class A beta-lactamase-related serine hydrolase [Gemmatimonadota bacterium]
MTSIRRACTTLSLLVLAVATTPGPQLHAQTASAASGARPTSFTLPPKDSVLQQKLRAVLERPRYRGLVRDGRLSVALVDITDPDRVVYAGWEDDRMRYAASLPKIAILVGVFDQIDRGELEYTPGLRAKLERMIRNSDNAISSEMIQLVGFQNIARTLQDPRHQLYDRRRGGGLWVGRGFGGLGVWRRDPIANTSHGATARQVARYFSMIERGELVSPWASAEMKTILADPAIHHKFVLGLEEARPRSVIYRKSGTWQNYHADAALVERDGRKYIAVVLLESPTRSSQGVLAALIVRLDELIFGEPAPPPPEASPPE